MPHPRSQEAEVVAARGDGAVSSIISRLIAKGGALLADDALQRLRRLEPAAAKIEEMVGEHEALGVALPARRTQLERPLKIIKPTLAQAEDMLDYVVERERQILSLPEEHNPFFEQSWAAKKLHTVLSSVFHGSHAALPEVKDLKKRLHKVESLIEKADQALVDFDGFQPVLPGPEHPTPVVIGRDAECRQIVAALYGTQQDDDNDDVDHHGRPYSVMGIHGAAGSGKTTLTQRAYARAQEDDDGSGFFDIFMWVQVGRLFTLHQVLYDMMTKANPLFNRDSDSDIDIALLTRSLQGELRRKRILLVLDDVRYDGNTDGAGLKQILSPLDVVEAGSKVLLTTRSVDALLVLGAVKSSCRHRIRELDDDVFLRLFMHYALGDDGVDERDRGILQVIGADIAAKLKRSPLQAKLVGTELRATPHIDVWRSVRDTNSIA